MAKMGERIVKVVCKLCGGHHGYRAEKPDGAEARRRRASRGEALGAARRYARRERRGAAAADPAVRSVEAAARLLRQGSFAPASGSSTRLRHRRGRRDAGRRARSRSCSPPAARAGLRQGGLDAGAPGRHQRRRSPIARTARVKRGTGPCRGWCCGRAWRARSGRPSVDLSRRAPHAARLADGALVLVAAPDGQPLARGFWDATAIAVRVLGGRGRETAGGSAAARSSTLGWPKRSTDGWP